MILEKTLSSGRGICTNVLSSRFDSKSGMQLEYARLWVGLCRNTEREQWTVRRRKEEPFRCRPFFFLPRSFQLHKRRHIFHIIAKHVCLLNYSLIS